METKRLEINDKIRALIMDCQLDFCWILIRVQKLLESFFWLRLLIGRA